MAKTQTREDAYRKAVLLYFNQVLLEKKQITQREFYLMQGKINRL